MNEGKNKSNIEVEVNKEKKVKKWKRKRRKNKKESVKCVENEFGWCNDGVNFEEGKLRRGC